MAEKEIYQGKVWRYGDNIDTDIIIAARYLNTFDPQELAKHCMADLDESFAQNVKAGIAEGGYGMEQCISKTFDPSELRNEFKHQQYCSDRFNQKRSAEEEDREADDTAGLMGADRILHGDSLHDADLSAGQDHGQDQGCHNSESADLDKQKNHDSAEHCPLRRGIEHDQSGHA